MNKGEKGNGRNKRSFKKTNPKSDTVHTMQDKYQLGMIDTLALLKSGEDLLNQS